MKTYHLMIQLKNSLVFYGSLGVFLGFFTTKVLFLHYEANEVTMAEGVIEADTNDSAASSVATTTGYSGNGQMNGKRIKILCMVMTSLPKNGERAKAVKNTWGKRCDTLIFLTSRKSKDLNTLLMPKYFEDDREHLWEKVKIGFSHAYASYYDFDWFLKTDDDSYVVMENLKLFLSAYNTSQPMFFGCRFYMPTSKSDPSRFRLDYKPNSYMSGGAGYVLSREALKQFVQIALKNTYCRKGSSLAEDLSMSHCLNSINVKFMDTRDYFGRLRFFPLMPFDKGYLQPGRLQHDFWYFTTLYDYANDGMDDACAESAISFHYVPTYMDLIEFFLYHLSPYQNNNY